ncbi:MULTISPECIES: hypothetical protein [Oceanobacillus]|uniref:hypothetical protein n=1 Tax=Oceanobacillus TaxID=182709 RepID=UPI0005ACB190|nr:hypothetical protein [Oceanobacillus oncorhynchi]UUI40962.1 hypothetical protein NP440_05070 [Oceanobacillus oncorhynchi]
MMAIGKLLFHYFRLRFFCKKDNTGSTNKKRRRRYMIANSGISITYKGFSDLIAGILYPFIKSIPKEIPANRMNIVREIPRIFTSITLQSAFKHFSIRIWIAIHIC